MYNSGDKPMLPSDELIHRIAYSETQAMMDRMEAIKGRPGNPEGVEMLKIGQTLCLYSRTMPWPQFNSVKGLNGADLKHLDEILAFYKSRNRAAQFEIVPARADQTVVRELAERGFYASGFHASLYHDLSRYRNEGTSAFAVSDSNQPVISVRELMEEELELYAAIHCRGTGLPDHGIPYVMENNKVLFHAPEWTFFLASYGEKPASVGVMHCKGGVASFTFAATLPEYRKAGLHTHLLGSRLEKAQALACGLAVSQCSFLSPSHRNMERVGMKLGYVRSTWTQLHA